MYIYNISLHVYKTSCLYFLISIKTRDYVYICEYKCIITRLNNHNSRRKSSSTTPSYRRFFEMLEYICGFKDGNKIFPRMFEREWKGKHDYLIKNGNTDLICSFKQQINIISELDNEMYQKARKNELRLVELFTE